MTELLLAETLSTTEGQQARLGKITVLVGPNNSGKSQTLLDIKSALTEKQSRPVVISGVGLSQTLRGSDVLVRTVERSHPSDPDKIIVHGLGSSMSESHSPTFDRARWDVVRNGTLDAIGQNPSFRTQVLPFLVAHVSTARRLSLVNPVDSIEFGVQPAENLLHMLFEQELSDSLSSAFSELFGQEIALDTASMRRLKLRIAPKIPQLTGVPRRDLEILEPFQLLHEQGEGFRCAAGVIMSLLCSDNRLVLLDEPEAFLHPAQARQLGLWISNHLENIGGQILIATHNASFLGGLIDGNNPPTIFRLQRTGNETIFHELATEDTRKLATSPLLSSQRILEAIFHSGVVVCEADSDRAVYQTATTNLMSDIRNEYFFLYAHEKESIHKVLGLLGRLEIPIAVIADIDCLRTRDTVERILACLDVEDRNEVLELRDETAAKIEGKVVDEETLRLKVSSSLRDKSASIEAGTYGISRRDLRRISQELVASVDPWSDVKTGGINALSDETRYKCELLLSRLEKKGIFLVPVGSLESWMNLGTTNKAKWVVKALEHLSQNGPPSELDSFLSRVFQHLGRIDRVVDSAKAETEG